jgi:hypothetical protein
MRTALLGFGFLLALVIAAPACGGDSNNGTSGPPFAPVEAFFNGADGFCSGCHTGGSTELLPSAMNLTTGSAYASIVDVDSIECAAMGGRKRIKPGAPEQSYIIDKMKGINLCMGVQMPLGLPPVAATWITLVEDWIRGGASR